MVCSSSCWSTVASIRRRRLFPALLQKKKKRYVIISVFLILVVCQTTRLSDSSSQLLVDVRIVDHDDTDNNIADDTANGSISRSSNTTSSGRSRSGIDTTTKHAVDAVTGPVKTTTTPLESDTPTSSSWIPVGDSWGYYEQSTNRLVVLVDHTYMFWNKGQQKLCHILQDMTYDYHHQRDDSTRRRRRRRRINQKEERPLPSSREANNDNKSIVNGVVDNSASSGLQTFSPPPPLLRLVVNCTHLAQSEAYGQGNWITAFYAVRLATTLAKVDLEFQCQLESSHELRPPATVVKTEEQQNEQLHQLKQSLLLPWFTGFYPARAAAVPTSTQEVGATRPRPQPLLWPYIPPAPTQNEACTNQYETIRIDKLALVMRDDMRRMARHVPLDENDYHDDVVIHFRCGDVLGGQLRNDFGMIPFRTYSARMDPNVTTSVGIVTQPFEPERNRAIDRTRSHLCRRVVQRLVEYLQTFLPHATVRVHNNLKETLPMAYARIVGAKRQAFTTLSSFGIFPVIGTYGEGYFQRGNEGVNPWTSHLRVGMGVGAGSQHHYFPNLHEMNATVIGAKAMYYVLKHYGLEPLLEWFVAEEGHVVQQVEEGISAAAKAPGKTLPKRPNGRGNNGKINY